MSDIIAALFDFRWGHPFGPAILKNVLGVLASSGTILRGTSQTIRSVQAVIDTAHTRLLVHRERWGALSRADIDILTLGPDGFLISVEHKIRGGAETYVREHQTSRLWRDAILRATKMGIDQSKVVGLFLTPGGDPPIDRNFGSLSFSQFAGAVRSALLQPRAIDEATDAAASILGFANFYERM